MPVKAYKKLYPSVVGLKNAKIVLVLVVVLVLDERVSDPW